MTNANRRCIRRVMFFLQHNDPVFRTRDTCRSRGCSRYICKQNNVRRVRSTWSQTCVAQRYSRCWMGKERFMRYNGDMGRTVKIIERYDPNRWVKDVWSASCRGDDFCRSFASYIVQICIGQHKFSKRKGRLEEQWSFKSSPHYCSWRLRLPWLWWLLPL